ncbi:outer membrane receptor for ferrienterochelin and colicin [Novosphingobium sp. SG751A]|uniref:hypothetical protein n=1 Tax=Novosphingobium sp. SG751A TaxID=2587000 RepID=UPI001555FFE4|nr:hypothetical protein [Novosphingobium sp. SG751A]NOW48282.1 outer membrane receptor for ferrienterochelin and colicin [Novosphingobium sp. SG751A]
MKTHHVSALLLLSASPLALSSQAHGQTAQPEQEIIVTGSRIITNGNNSPAPVTVVSTEQLFRAQPSTIADRAEQHADLCQFARAMCSICVALGRCAR